MSNTKPFSVLIFLFLDVTWNSRRVLVQAFSPEDKFLKIPSYVATKNGSNCYFFKTVISYLSAVQSEAVFVMVNEI